MANKHLAIFLFLALVGFACTSKTQDSQFSPSAEINSWLDSLTLAYDNNQWEHVRVYCHNIWACDSLYEGIESYYAQSLIANGLPDSAINYIAAVTCNQIIIRYGLLQLQAIAYYQKGDIVTSAELFDQCITAVDPNLEYIESVVHFFEKDNHLKQALHFRESAVLKMYKSDARIEEKLRYAAILDSIDPGNKTAEYVHEQILPKGSDVYLPGFDDDIEDNHDMELYFSDPYF